MRNKLTIILSGLLLAVGWTNVAQAQLKAEYMSAKKHDISSVSNVSDPVAKQESRAPLLREKSRLSHVAIADGSWEVLNRAPRRATITADATHVKSWYEAIKYEWYDANGNLQPEVSITEPATDPYQIAYLLGTTYTNPVIPGIKYSEALLRDLPYVNIDFGWELPYHPRWNKNSVVTGTNFRDLVIKVGSQSINLRSIKVYNQSNTLLTSWDATNIGNGYTTTRGNNTYYLLQNLGWVNIADVVHGSYDHGDVGFTYGNIVIPANLLNGNSRIRLVVNAYGDYDGIPIYVNGVSKDLTDEPADYTWEYEGISAKTSYIPDENGYTVFLVKVKDGTSGAPKTTSSWDSGTNSVINFIDTYIDEVQLLTDGTRLNTGTADAGTMFAYSGELNRFYFIGKGKMAFTGSNEAPYDDLYDYGPTYSMYEEFSPTTTAFGSEITDFYSKLLYGNSYNIIHDCQGVIPLEHYFSMSGKTGTEHKSLTNLVLWIPDQRGIEGKPRDYEEEFLPHVGLYTITLESQAKPVAYDYVEGNRNYKVTLDWVSSLNTILDFDVEQDYELWVYVFDENGNPVASEKIIEHLQDEVVHDETTYSYYVEQKPESYTIVYRVKGWPKDATNTPGHYPDDPEEGNFFALSNLSPVLIPGYRDFLSLAVDHYESDFVINEEHNYYRNFLSVNNQNPDNALTPYRITHGEANYELSRFDVADPDSLTKAADLVFSVLNNEVKYNINYSNQFYIDNADQSGNTQTLTGYTDPNALGCPREGVITRISNGSSNPEPVNIFAKVNFINELTSGDEYLIVCEDTHVALNGSLTDFYNTKTGFTNAIWANPYNEVIPATTRARAATFTIEESGSGYTIKSKSGYYIGNASATNTQITESTSTPYSNSISFNDGNASINYIHTTNNGTTYNYNLKYASASNMQRFAYTSSNQNYRNIQLYKLTTATGGYGVLNDFLDNWTYTENGLVVFDLPWKSTQVKLQDSSAGTSSGYFMIQNNGKLRFIMPAGYANANVKFVIHNAPVSSNYYFGTFKLTSSTGAEQTITIPEGNVVYGNRDYEVIFTGISSDDVITITGTHTVGSTLYNYSPDFEYIHVFVEGGHDGISENSALNLGAIKFVDQFKAETKENKHPYRYGYVLKAVGGTNESAMPEVPVKHTDPDAYGYYSVNEIQGDTVAPLFQVNVMNADVNMTLSREPETYYYTLYRKPSNQNNATWELLSKLQRREDDSYQELYDKLTQYEHQISNPPVSATAPWPVDRYDNDTVIGVYNSSMSYVPVIWTHGDQDNRRVKWDTEKRHNSYGAPIWKTGVAEVNLISATAERQESSTTKWSYGGEDCSLYMLDKIVAEAKLPTSNNINYVPYMFRIFVVSDNHKLRGYKRIADGVDEERPGSHYDGDMIADDALKCVWSGYVNDPNNENLGVNIEYDDETGIYTFRKNKVDRTNPNGAWDKDKENAIFGGLENIVKYEDGNWKINPQDLTIVVRFYYLVDGFNADAPGQSQQLRGGYGNDDPAGSGAESSLPPSGWTGLNDLLFSTTVESVTYVNPQGMQSDRPFEGLNIEIIRYSDGRVTTTKVLK